MAKTRHMHKRMSQRGITDRLLKIVSNYGMAQGDRRILDKKNVDALLKSIDSFRSDLLKVRDKGGLVVVESEGSLITSYNLTSYSRRKLH